MISSQTIFFVWRRVIDLNKDLKAAWLKLVRRLKTPLSLLQNGSYLRNLRSPCRSLISLRMGVLE